MDIIRIDNKGIEKETLFPQSINHIDNWAKKFGLLNSYNTLLESQYLGRYQLGLIKSLRNAEPLTENQLLFIKKIEAAVEIINTLEIHPDMKQTIINEIITNDTPWLHDSPIAKIPKQIKIEEVIKDEFVRILEVDYIDENCNIGGVCPYYKKNNPKLVYEHCITLDSFDDVDKKIIAFALDRKPYYRNQALWSNTIEDMNNVIIDWERGTIGFEGAGLDLGFNNFHFLLNIFSWEDYGDNLYEKSIEKKKIYLRNSDWFKTFTPDFEQGK